RGPGGPAATGDRRGRPGRGGAVHGDLPLQPGRSAGDAGHGNWVTAVARKAASGGTASLEATELLHIDGIQPRGVVVGKRNANSEGLVWRSCVFGRNRPD